MFSPKVSGQLAGVIYVNVMVSSKEIVPFLCSIPMLVIKHTKS